MGIVEESLYLLVQVLTTLLILLILLNNLIIWYNTIIRIKIKILNNTKYMISVIAATSRL